MMDNPYPDSAVRSMRGLPVHRDHIIARDAWEQGFEAALSAVLSDKAVEAATQGVFPANAPTPEGLGLRLTHFRARWIAKRALAAAVESVRSEGT